MSLSDLSSMAKMSVVGGRERLALLCLAGVKGGSGLEFQLNTSYMDEDILISANKPFNATQILSCPRKTFRNETNGRVRTRKERGSRGGRKEKRKY